MNSINQMIDQWCQQLRERSTLSEDWLEEIRDHVYCDVVSQMESGLSGPDAFQAAIEKIGHHDDIEQEYQKNRSLLYKIFCSHQADKNQEPTMKKKRPGHVPVYHAMIFAAALLLSAVLLKGTENAESMFILLIALWFASSLMIQDVRKQVSCEVRFIKGLFKSKG